MTEGAATPTATNHIKSRGRNMTTNNTTTSNEKSADIGAPNLNGNAQTIIDAASQIDVVRRCINSYKGQSLDLSGIDLILASVNKSLHQHTKLLINEEDSTCGNVIDARYSTESNEPAMFSYLQNLLGIKPLPCGKTSLNKGPY